ncbi:PF01973 family protein [Leptospira santarosai str. CBC379]|uniref:PF01973 family protein n=1 Tax=Leptospira santarosai str. MOR084 TaxID=1049984 RepID=A0A0E2BBC5_9LEPT|nr:6-hydroxymethylpterin diphosphokinase MptE-like protein [Leptospira santarosai]EKO32667.1 PF01973 family protein [Leptospira santarosai str. MOR084]EKR90089.1 PF01973 family protein [Leptospira santarosai str. CBC379]
MIYSVPDESVLQKNLKTLPSSVEEKILRSPSPVSMEIKTSKTGHPVLIADGIALHSLIDPITESKRLLVGLKKEDEERVFLFFGAGIGYVVQESLKFKNLTAVWMEAEPAVIRYALSLFDYSEFLESGRLRILLAPILEDDLYAAFRGISGFPISFIPHRGSNQWKKDSYQELRLISEGFFHKKDVNISTLVRFEKIWTRNFIFNLPELARMQPIGSLFGLCKGKADILVCGAGPSLILSLEDIRTYRKNLILIAVDTALTVLWNAGIDPDLFFSVDPQALNTKYLEGYNGNAKIVFDPTSSYHSLRLPGKFKKGFFTSSPFPLIKILSSKPEEEIGAVDFGGSVSTNSVSLAEKMEARNILLVGQDLSFPNKLAHCKGAVLEERLNHIESRKLRREYHNHKQMTALPVKRTRSIRGEEIRTNEKLLIFKKWFEEHPKKNPWFNFGKDGVILEGIPNADFSEYMQKNECDLEFVRSIKYKIHNIANVFEFDSPEKESAFEGKSDRVSAEYKVESEVSIQNTTVGKTPSNTQERILSELKVLFEQLKGFSEKVTRGRILSARLYSQIQAEDKFKDQILKHLKEMDRIDEEVSSRKGLTEILGMSIQRTVLMITEGYEGGLSLEEKKNERLGIAKKSLLLYQGLEDACKLHSKLIGKTITILRARLKT